MKITVSSYSFGNWLKENSQLAAIQKLKEMGSDAIAFSRILPHDGSTEAQYAEKLRLECERLGMTISDYVFPSDFIDGSNGDTDREIARVKEQVDIAEILGVNLIRHDASHGKSIRSFEKALPILAKGCAEVTDYAAKKGIRTMIENHGLFCQGSERVLQLLQAVGHANFGLLCDIGNFGGVDEDCFTSVSRLMELIVHVHAKDCFTRSGMCYNPGRGYNLSRGGNYRRATIFGHGNVPTYQILNAIRASGYNGYVSLEFEGMESVMDGVTIGSENLQRMIRDIEGK